MKKLKNILIKRFGGNKEEELLGGKRIIPQKLDMLPLRFHIKLKL